MSISTPPPAAPPKKRGLGCLGCGCLVLIVLVLLLLGLIGGGGYVIYHKAVALTSPTPAPIPAATITDESYQATWQKFTDFDHDLKDHRPSTLQLSADEINALIARNPDISGKNIHASVSFSGDEGQLQASVPASLVQLGQDRYFNVNATFGVGFDASTHSVVVDLKSLQCGDNVLVGPALNSQQATALMMTSFNQSFNNELRKNPEAAAFLDQAKSVSIVNGQLVIQTQ